MSFSSFILLSLMEKHISLEIEKKDPSRGSVGWILFFRLILEGSSMNWQSVLLSLRMFSKLTPEILSRQRYEYSFNILSLISLYALQKVSIWQIFSLRLSSHSLQLGDPPDCSLLVSYVYKSPISILYGNDFFSHPMLLPNQIRQGGGDQIDQAMKH